ncbi:MAG TPA: energy transducer TonB [Gemmatimonadaceae bacterium]|nr:energy transducer TonB [Gemmatimonadaceae bacterium]
MTSISRIRFSLVAVAAVALSVLHPADVMAQDASRTYNLSEVETKPSLASVTSFQRLVAEGYPEDLKRRRLGGIAEVAFVVDASGKVEPGSVEVVDATQPAFGEAAKKALLMAGFKPGKVSGNAVRTKVSLPIVYKAN